MLGLSIERSTVGSSVLVSQRPACSSGSGDHSLPRETCSVRSHGSVGPLSLSPQPYTSLTDAKPAPDSDTGKRKYAQCHRFKV